MNTLSQQRPAYILEICGFSVLAGLAVNVIEIYLELNIFFLKNDKKSDCELFCIKIRSILTYQD